MPVQFEYQLFISEVHKWKLAFATGKRSRTGRFEIDWQEAFQAKIMHIMVSAVGSAGDINPFIAVAAALQKGGHRVDFIANPVFADRVERQGLALLPLGTLADYEQALQDPRLWQLKEAFPVTWKLAIQAAGINYELIEKYHTAGDTLLVGSTLAIGARLAQEKLKLPLVSVHLSPAVFLSAYDMPQSPTCPFPDWTPSWLRSVFIDICDHILLDPACKPLLNNLRAQLRLPPVAQVFKKWLHSPDKVIGAFPEWFAKVQPDWPPNSVNSGFPLYTSAFDSGLAPELENFLDRDSAPLVFTAGTAMAFARDFMSTGLKAARKTGRRALFVCNFADQIDMENNETVMHVPYANFQALFRRAALVVHHGGIGTSAMALHCGVPQLIVPFAHDQFDNGRRFERLGVAKMVRQSHNLAEWIASIEELLRPRQRRLAAQFSEKLGDESAGTEATVEIIKSLINARIN